MKLSDAEQLLALTDNIIWQAIDANPTGDWISALPEELRTGKSLENAKRLQVELAKPESEQFRPDPDAVRCCYSRTNGITINVGPTSCRNLGSPDTAK